MRRPFQDYQITY